MTTTFVCPDTLDDLVLVEYPGFVKNTDRALATLGGIESIKKVYDSPKDRLELIFRKSDPLAHPACGDRLTKKCLVFRITKRKDEGDPKVEVVGKVQTSFKFDTLAEFQWLPMQRTNMVDVIDSSKIHEGLNIKRTKESLNPTYKSVLDDVLPIKNPFDNTLKNFNPDAPLLVLPAVFSRFDTSREIHQPHPKFRSQEMRDEFMRQESMSIIGRTRKKRTTMSYILNYNDKIPDRAQEKLVKERALLSQQERVLLPKLRRCFERQRVWSKASLCYDLGCSTLDIKYILPLVAYHYLNGPFRTMWVCYGYDPHKDKSSKLLQTLDFRVKPPQDQQEYSKRSLNQYQLPMRKNAEKVKNKAQTDLKVMISAVGAQAFEDSIIDDPYGKTKGQVINEAMCKFRPDLVPAARQLSYQLKDIEIDEVQSVIHSNDGDEPNDCSEKDGWLPDGSIDKIRKIMTKSLNDTLEMITSRLEDT